MQKDTALHSGGEAPGYDERQAGLRASSLAPLQLWGSGALSHTVYSILFDGLALYLPVF